MFIVKTSNQQITTKLIICGYTGTGKSNIINRLCDDKFIEQYIKTIGVDFKIKNTNFNNLNLKYQIWDTHGSTAQKFGNQTYTKGAVCVIFVYAVNDKDSFDHLKLLIEKLNKSINQKCLKIIVGNKCDTQNRQVQMEQAMALAQYYKMEYIQTSAKEKIRIDLLSEIINSYVQKAVKSQLQARQQLKLKNPYNITKLQDN